MRKLRLLSIQPATPYYAWQMEVFLTRTIAQGYNPNFIDVVCATEGGGIDQSWLILQQAFPGVRFFFYRDERVDRRYACSVQAHILKKHWQQFPELKNDAVFFHDADFIFTRYFDFTPYLQDDKWYFSNCDSYLGADYLESKGEHPTKLFKERPEMLLDGMATVVGICSCTIRANRGKSGGAQKLLKNVTAGYWDEVDRDITNLYAWLLDNKDEYGEGETNDIQIWTTNMWCELWNAWKRGVKVEIPAEFDFAWATCHASRWSEKVFFHNAGVQHANQGMFFKGAYISKLPYGVELELSDERCSKQYYDYVQEVGENSVLL